MSNGSQNISSKSPYEEPIGFSRAVRIGNIVWVGGTAPIGPDGKTVGAGDPAAQTRRCFEIIGEASSNLARYDGVRYGLRVPGGDIIEQYENTRSEGFGAEVKRRVLIGTYVLSAGYYDAYYLKAQKVRTLIKRDFERVFKDVDVLLTPATPGPAFALGEKSGDPIEMYLNDIFTVPANMSGLPGISIPAGFSGEGTPLGLQLISRAFDEEMLFRVGKVIEDAAGGLPGPDDWWSVA